MLLGSGSAFAAECLAGNFVGINFGMPIDFSGTFGDDWQQFNKRYILTYLNHSPDKNRIAAGLACASLYTVGMKMQIGDYVISPIGNGSYRVAQISGDYRYVADSNLPHRRTVQWLERTIPTDQMSSEFIRSCGSQLTVINLSNSGHATELKKLINSSSMKSQTPELSQRTDLYAFALEKHLEEFIVKNWHTLALGQQYESHPPTIPDWKLGYRHPCHQQRQKETTGHRTQTRAGKRRKWSVRSCATWGMSKTALPNQNKKCTGLSSRMKMIRK
jgi:restriction system protein